MNNLNDKIIGIVGGMGPRAGLEIFNYIINHTSTSIDQEHLSVILMSFPKQLVDRTLFLEKKISVNPAFNISKIIIKLENAGAQIIGIACNTSHSSAIFDVILAELRERNSKVKLLNMPFEVCNYLNNSYSYVNRVGLLTTNGVYKSEVYKETLENLGFNVIVPDYKFQNDVIHRMIYDEKIGIKSVSNKITAEVHSLMKRALSFFKEKNTEAIILGCTEFSLVIKEKLIDDMIIVDSSEVLAKALIKEAKNTSTELVMKLEEK
jgi:aspartate racemase